MRYLFAFVAATIITITSGFAPTPAPLSSTTWASSTIDVTGGSYVDVPTFDSSLGTLDHATVKFGRYIVTYTIRAENTSTGNSCSQFMWITSIATASNTHYGNVCWFPNSDSADFALDAYDGITDFGGASGETQVNSYDYNNVGLRTITDSTFLGLVNGDGVTTWRLDVSESSTGDFGGSCSNAINSFATDAKTTFRITYYYN